MTSCHFLTPNRWWLLKGGKMAYREREDADEREKVSWNIAGDHARHISSLIIKATTFYLKGDLGNWYWTLTALREMINHELSKTEKEELDEVEKQASEYNPKWEASKESERTDKEFIEKFYKLKSDFIRVTRRYQRALMDLLREQGYFPAKEDRTKLGF